MIIRKINKNDFNQIINLLKQLSDSVKLDKNSFDLFIDSLNKNHQIWIIEENDILIVTGTILIENKIIHNFGKVGHIEDIVVDKNNRNRKLGTKILEHLINIAKKDNCYKVILNCNIKFENFYKKNNFKTNGLEMAMYF